MPLLTSISKGRVTCGLLAGYLEVSFVFDPSSTNCVNGHRDEQCSQTVDVWIL